MTREIALGVRFCFVPAARFKTSRLLLQMAVPLRLNQANVTAANALLPFLLHRSCAAYPTPRLLESELAALYGAKLSAYVQKTGETQLLSIALTAIDDRFALGGESVAEGCAALLLDLLFQPMLADGLFTEESVALEKRLLMERLESEEGNKWRYAQNRCEALMCGNESYGLNPLGEAEAIAALRPEELTQAWRQLLRSAPMQFVLVGNGGDEAVCEALRQRFAGMTRQPVVLETRFVQRAGEQKTIREEQLIEQAKLVLGFRAGMKDADDHRHARLVMTDLFGGGVYSKLFLNVREKMSLCYACRADLHAMKGILMVRSGVDTEKADEARDAILEQMRQMQTGAFTDEELGTAKRALCDSIQTAADLPESLASWYTRGLLRGDYSSLQEECECIRKVMREEVVATAREVTLDTVYLLAARKEAAK
ncbi:MAG: insulinase family protein [Oscillospiraceae bacterium]|nr:insulinase family protein [Oscillospiraceae bacterium]